jgi:hypothetical protein
MKKAVFWDVVPCRQTESVAPALAGSLTDFVVFYPEDGGNTFLRNVS